MCSPDTYHDPTRIYIPWPTQSGSCPHASDAGGAGEQKTDLPPDLLDASNGPFFRASPACRQWTSCTMPWAEDRGITKGLWRESNGIAQCFAK